MLQGNLKREVGWEKSKHQTPDPPSIIFNPYYIIIIINDPYT